MRVKKALNITLRVLTTVILIFSICVMIFTIISVNTVGKDADFLGYKPYIVLSDSMQDTFEVGDLSISRATDVEMLEPGDIITFKSIDPSNYGEVVTHKIREITTYEGEPAFVTYGTTTGVYPVPFDNVIGEYQFRLPKMGYFFEFLISPTGYVVVILIPFLLLILLQAIHFIKLLRQYKRELRAEAAEQKAQVEMERRRAQEMEEELERLRAQVKEHSMDSSKSDVE